MLMEDAMVPETGKLIEAFDETRRTLYVLISSLAATVISLPVVWYFAAAYAAPGLVA
jgi:hypothetical protein